MTIASECPWCRTLLYSGPPSNCILGPRVVVFTTRTSIKNTYVFVSLSLSLRAFREIISHIVPLSDHSIKPLPTFYYLDPKNCQI